jgi:hypothetical protein
MFKNGLVRSAHVRNRSKTDLMPAQFFHEALVSSWQAVYKLVSDDQEGIETALKQLVRRFT